MKLKFIHIIYFLLFYFTAEDFLLSQLPVSEALYTYSRFGGELILYGMLFYFFGMRRIQGRGILRTPLDVFILLYMAWVLISSIYNFNGPVAIFQKERIFFRYIPVFYLLVNMDNVGIHTVRRTLKVVLAVGLLQLVLGVGQHFLLKEISDFWLPRETSVEVGGVGKEFRAEHGFKQGIILGTMTMPGHLATYLMMVGVFIVSAIYFRRSKIFVRFFGSRALTYGAFLLIAAGIFFTYSRASLMLLVLAVPIAVFYSGAVTKLVYNTILLAFTLVLITPLFLLLSNGDDSQAPTTKKEYTPVEEFTRLFTREYLVEEASNNRLWVLTDIGGTLLGRLNLIGYGADESKVREKLYRAGVHKDVLTYRPFKDVYWINIMSHFGILGVTFMVLIFYQLFRISRWLYHRDTEPLFQFMGYFMMVLLIVMALKTFFLSTLEYRSINYTLWVFAGLLINRYVRVKNADRALEAESA